MKNTVKSENMICYNKILHETLPAEKVFSEDDLYWVGSIVKNQGKYEDDFFIVTLEK